MVFHTPPTAAGGKVNAALGEHLEVSFLSSAHSCKAFVFTRFTVGKRLSAINVQGGKWSQMGSGFANMSLCQRSAARSALTFEKSHRQCNPLLNLQFNGCFCHNLL